MCEDLTRSGVGLGNLTDFWSKFKKILSKAKGKVDLFHTIFSHVVSKSSLTEKRKALQTALISKYYILMKDLIANTTILPPTKNTQKWLEKIVFREPSKHELMNFLSVFPHENWDWDLVSSSSGVVASRLLYYHEWFRKWNWKILSGNLAISFSYIARHPELPWDYKEVSGRSDLEFDYVLKHLVFEWDWEAISANRAITTENIVNHPDLDWRYEQLSSHPAITLEFVLTHKSIPHKNKWNRLELSRNPAITLKDVEENIDRKWNCLGLSRNPGVRLAFILANPDLSTDPNEKWFWPEISKNPGVTLEEIEQTINDPRWDFSSMSYHPGLTIVFVMKYPKKRWIWEVVSARLDATFELIDQNLSSKGNELPWDFQEFSRRPDLDPNFLKKYQTNPKWDWFLVSGNTSIPFSFIVANPRMKWDPAGLSGRIDIDLDYLYESWADARLNWEELSSNAGVPLWFIYETSKKKGNKVGDREFPWKWKSSGFYSDTIFKNPNMTIGFALLFKEKIDFGANGLSGNEFTRDENFVKLQAIKRQIEETVHITGASSGTRDIGKVITRYVN